MKKRSPLNKEKVKEMHKIAKNPYGNHCFNCLNAVMYALEIEKKLKWQWDDDIDYLIGKTELVSETIYQADDFSGDGLDELAKPKIGDVLALYDDSGEAMHFAVYTGRHGWFNKRGGLNTAYSSIYDIIFDYDGHDGYYVNKVEIRRKRGA